MPRLWIVWLCAGLGCLLPAGCASGIGGTPSSTPPASGAQLTEPATTLTVEPSGPETPMPTQPAKPSLFVAKLPIGGEADEFRGCVPISYLGKTEIPPAARIVLTSATFDRPYFEVGGSGCSGEGVSCLDAGFAFTAGNAGSIDGMCVVPIRAVGGKTGDRVALSVAGRVECSSGETAVCDGFAQRLRAEPLTIEVRVPPPRPTIFSPSPAVTTPPRTTSATATTPTTIAATGT